MSKRMRFLDYLDWLSNNQIYLQTKYYTKKIAEHPGKILERDYLLPRKISQSELARHIGCTHAKINEIIHGRRGVTAQFAIQLEHELGVSAEYWVSLQASYDLAKCRADRLE